MPKIAGAEFLARAYSLLDEARHLLSRAQIRAEIQRERGRNSPEYKELESARVYAYRAVEALNKLAYGLQKVGRKAPYYAPPPMSRAQRSWMKRTIEAGRKSRR